jgi:tRNA (cytidine32/uridine32-2'-O)-methyltransferase
MLDAPLELLRYGHGKMGNAVQIVGRSVERIDDPDSVAFTLQSAFLTEDCVVGMKATDFFYNGLLAGPVDFTDVIVACLAGHRYRVDAPQAASHDFARRMGGLGGDVNGGMRHGLGTGAMTEKGGGAANDNRSDGGTAERLARFRVVLINTTHPGNIGAAARAMKVMGLSQLHLVAPKTWPSADATAMASGAADLLQSARVHDTLDEALSGARLVLGTSARLRSLSMPQLDVRAAACRGLEETAQSQDGDVALLFGREAHGLTNEEIQRCHFLVHIDTNPEFGSLNLAQAVQVAAYELRVNALGGAGEEQAATDWAPVDAGQMERFYEHLESALKHIRFLNPAHPKRLMMRLRRLFNRARPDQNEMNILRGILAAAERGEFRGLPGEASENNESD